MNKYTPIEEIEFSQAWRVKRAVKIYNLSKDKTQRIKKLGDLEDYDVINFLGIGPKTTEYLHEVLSTLE